jgi:hypothetical protein
LFGAVVSLKPMYSGFGLSTLITFKVRLNN